MFSPPRDPTAPGTKSPFGTWVQSSSWSHFPGHPLGTPCLYDPMEILPKCSFKLLSLSTRNILFLSHSWLLPIRPMPVISRVTSSELSSQIILPFQAQSPCSPLLSFPPEEWWSPACITVYRTLTTHHCPDLLCACPQLYHEVLERRTVPDSFMYL